MAAPKPASQPSGRWPNQVIRTADGRLLVRGVDVPAGAEWDQVAAGKTTGYYAVIAEGSKGRELTTVTDKDKALSIARKAGLVDVKPQARKR